ncbi:hypothetical protein ASD24_24300 [Paenibacillus sp. Root52]|nr:hypothetical protein ASD24_24300 [Paenibacillus sp. Root52]
MTPTLYAYSSGVFVLTQWVDGLNLGTYKKTHGRLPTNLIYDFYLTELALLSSGYKDWDTKLAESVIWLESGDVRRLDYGLCEPIPESMQPGMLNTLKKEIGDIYINNIDKIRQTLFYAGMTSIEVEEAIIAFQSYIPRLV